MNARSLTFEVEYARADLVAAAEVTYTIADGTTVTESVTLPWKSEEIAITPGRSYRVSATAPEVQGSAFNCGVHTDNRWNAGTSGTGGICVYTFPDDVGDRQAVVPPSGGTSLLRLPQREPGREGGRFSWRWSSVGLRA